MTADQILAAHPSSIIIALTDPYKKRVRFVREDEYGQHNIDPPSDFRSKFGIWKLKPVYRRKMGRAVV
jgi:hypothetical protein